MEKAIFLTNTFEPFTSSWGALCVPLQHGNGYILPLGWEQELSQRGIEFTEIEITIEETNESIHL